jgi:hypothetical protein
VTFKELQKLVQSQTGPEKSQLLQRLRDKPFWIWDQTIHKQEDIKTKGDFCFNHIIGLPIKDIEKPLFDYEKLLNDSLLTIVLPLTLISDIYGMNFDVMPELRSPYGYYFALGLMAAVGGGMIGYFKRKNWI